MEKKKGNTKFHNYVLLKQRNKILNYNIKIEPHSCISLKK